MGDPEDQIGIVITPNTVRELAGLLAAAIAARKAGIAPPAAWENDATEMAHRLLDILEFIDSQKGGGGPDPRMN